MSGGSPLVAGAEQDSISSRGRRGGDHVGDITLEAARRRLHEPTVPGPARLELEASCRKAWANRGAIRERLGSFAPTRLLEGFAQTAKEGAQGAALLADGLAGGANRELVELLAIREARGTVLDHLYIISRERARRRLEGGPA